MSRSAVWQAAVIAPPLALYGGAIAGFIAPWWLYILCLAVSTAAGIMLITEVVDE